MRCIFLFIALLVAAPCQGQNLMLLGAGATGKKTAVTYQGPGDIIAFNTWFSCARVYQSSAATTSTNLCDLVATASTGGYTAGGAVCTLRGSSSGLVDLTAYCSNSVESNVSPATACGHATTCSISKAYNQVSPGTNDATNATLAQMPILRFATANGLPGIQCVSTGTSCSLSTPNITQSQPFTFSFAWQTDGSFTSTQYWAGNGTNSNGVLSNGNGAAANKVFMSSNVLSAGVSQTDGSLHAINALFSGASSQINVDGTDTTQNPSTLGFSANGFRLHRANPGGGQDQSTIMEGGLIAATTTLANRNNLCHNQSSATLGYNISGASC